MSSSRPIAAENAPGWGRYPRLENQKISYVKTDAPVFVPKEVSLPRGAGRSYGDICCLSNGTLLSSAHMDRLLSFDAKSGILRAESGTLLGEILEIFAPRGWFLPVLPGTQFVTLGGAVASDIHGKNHHVLGTFGHSLRAFELIRSSGERLFCSSNENSDMFFATIGGLGLTGFISWVEVQMIPVESTFIESEHTRFKGLESFFDLSNQNAHTQYSVAWLDIIKNNVCNLSGVFFTGTHAKSERQIQGPRKRPQEIVVPVDFPSWVLNPLSMKAFNTIYEMKHRRSRFSLQDYRKFFFPLDAIHNWNRLYGKRGFLQYQCLVPFDAPFRSKGLERVLEMVIQKRLPSFLTVLKVFGAKAPCGLMSFAHEGVTLTMDFAMTGSDLLDALDELDKIVIEFGGKIYPAKDARMKADTFKLMYPHWKVLETLRDPSIQSDFWKRVTV